MRIMSLIQELGTNKQYILYDLSKLSYKHVKAFLRLMRKYDYKYIKSTDPNAKIRLFKKI